MHASCESTVHASMLSVTRKILLLYLGNTYTRAFLYLSG